MTKKGIKMLNPEYLNNINLIKLSPTATFTDYKHFCEMGIKKGITKITVPPVYVNKLKELYKTIKISTIIDYPYGFSGIENAIIEIKNLNADEFGIVLNYNNIKSNKWIITENSLKKLKETTGKPIKIFLNTDYLTKTEKKELAKLFKKYKIDCVELYNDTSVSTEDINIFFKDLKVQVTSPKQVINTIEELFKAGVTTIGITNIECLTDDVKIYKRKLKG